jgi:hypothetical protein
MRGVRESSGIVASRRTPGLYWTHSDSGGRSELYAVDSTGQPVGKPVIVTGATNVDWEDIAGDESGNLWIADIGNNLSFRTDLSLWVVPEPQPGSARSATRTRGYSPRRRWSSMPRHCSWPAGGPTS